MDFIYEPHVCFDLMTPTVALTSDFHRFREVYDYYSALFDSLDATLPRESPDRMNVERQCLAREIVNILACEGPDRVERYYLYPAMLLPVLHPAFSPFFLKFKKLIVKLLHVAGTKLLGNGEQE